MKNLLVPLMGALALLCTAPSLTSCASDGAAVSAPSAALSIQKALYAAEAAYNVPAHAYVTLDASGSLPASVKEKAKPALESAYAALLRARAAAKAGDLAMTLAEGSTTERLASAANALIPRQ